MTATPLGRYRVMAYVVGVMLLVLCVAIVVKYAGHSPGPVAVVGPIHGFLYVVYLAATADLARRHRWPPRRVVLVALAGTIPLLSFVAERRVTADELAAGRDRATRPA